MDKTGRNTGRGRFREKVHFQRELISTHELYNYNIDGNLLKDEHKKYLDRKVVPVLKNYRTHVKLVGRASQSGNREYNRALSLERVLRVKDYLISKGLSEAQVPGEQMRAAGEDLSTSDSPEDELDRAVTVKVGWGTKPRPIFPERVTPIIVTDKPPPFKLPKFKFPKSKFKFPNINIKLSRVKVSRRWKIRQTGAAELSGFGMVGASATGFWIVDTTNNEEIVCVMPAATAGGPELPASITLRGPWSHFTTKDAHRISDFAAEATLLSMPTAGWSAADSQLSVRGVSNPFISVKTGFTIGVSTGGVAAGPLLCSQPQPYNARGYLHPVTGWRYE